MRRRIRPRYRVGLSALLVLAAAVVIGGSSALANPVAGAAFTTDNPHLTGACLNGPSGDTSSVNCNLYTDKPDVWINGGPTNGVSQLTAGSYFFAVMVPGGQPDPNDGSAKNLSDISSAGGVNDTCGDAYTNRTFSVDGNGHISAYSGDGADYYTNPNSPDTCTGDGSADPHQYDQSQVSSGSNLIQLFPFDTTSNPGGVYILAICSLAHAGDAPGVPGVAARDCKYDAFKVKSSECTVNCGGGLSDLAVIKDATPGFTRTFAWDSSKSVDKTLVEKTGGGSATFNYVVSVTHDSGTDSDWVVNGTITAFNPNNVDVTVGVSDAVSDDNAPGNGGLDNVTCTPDDASLVVPAQDQVATGYSCTYPQAPSTSTETNTATISWTDNGTTKTADFSVDFTFADPPSTLVDDCATFTDTFGLHGTTGTGSTLGTVCQDGSTSGLGTGVTWDATNSAFDYSRTITMPASGCLTYDNTADFTTDTSSSTDGTLDDNSQSVTVCSPVKTSALTIGFWKTTNGQNLITTYGCPSGKTSLATYLATLGPTDQGPFSNASSCGSTIATYVLNILKGASATNMNVMLKAQMMGTALDVYFSDPNLGYTSTTSGGKKPPSVFLTNGALGGFNMDLTAICPMIDNTTTGTATCKNNTPSTDGHLSGAFNTDCSTVQDLLDYESTLPPFNGVTGTSSNWYAGNRTKEEIAKNTFDQINNRDAFICFP